MLTNWNNKVLYIGVTNNLLRRVQEHKDKKAKNSFTSKYNLNKLVYYEYFDSIETAISREKELKKWRREKKDDLVNELNPQWKELYDSLF